MEPIEREKVERLLNYLLKEANKEYEKANRAWYTTEHEAVAEALDEVCEMIGELLGMSGAEIRERSRKLKGGE